MHRSVRPRGYLVRPGGPPTAPVVWVKRGWIKTPKNHTSVGRCETSSWIPTVAQNSPTTVLWDRAFCWDATLLQYAIGCYASTCCFELNGVIQDHQVQPPGCFGPLQIANTKVLSRQSRRCFSPRRSVPTEARRGARGLCHTLLKGVAHSVAREAQNGAKGHPVAARRRDDWQDI